MNVSVNVGGPTIVMAHASHGPSFIVRAIWYIFIGWWLAGLTISVGYLAAATIIGLPVAFYLFNRIPAVMTLRPRTREFAAHVRDGVTYLKEQTIEQHPLWLRAVYFLLVGWWVGAFWLSLAYALCLLIITLPLGLLMFDRTPGVMTLLRH